MIPFIHRPFVYLADQLGAGPDELKLIFSILVSYPLAGLLKRVPDARPAQKNLFSLSISIFFLTGLFDLWDGLQTMLISAGGAYAIAKFLRGSRYMPWVGFVFLMGHMSVNHIARQAANSPRSVDITGAQMVLVMKLSAFCWNVADGLLPEDELSDFQKDRRLTELPDLLDYAGFVFFFPSLLTGPAFDFAEYRRWLDTTMFEVPAHVDPAKKPPTRRKRKIPRSGTPAMVKLVTSLLWIFAFLKLSAYFDHTVLLQDSYMEYSFSYRLFVLHMVGFTARTKYYGVWTLAEGACILAGLGYNGVDPLTGKVSWDRLQNIDPWGVEFAQNTRGYLESWNINTNKWLRNYIYLRVTPRGKKPGFRASLATFTTSAFWHGFYPGYYLSFVLASFIQTVAKNMRRIFRPFFLDPRTGADLPSKKFYDVASWFTTQLTFSFAVAPFLLLSFSDSLLAWSRVYYYAIIGTLTLMAFFASPAKKFLKNKMEKRNADAGVGVNGDAGRPGNGRLSRSASSDSLASRTPVMGMPQDLEKEFDDAMSEIRAFEAEKRK
ncbi:MBOAT, membrane-bound O-acyltransferase family-domain-containing protein [Parachaetomium inaequale]|uniref:MBOAT, membrane-bound O-acyltransferase family-domain-containing protein n=1 Tax=Parachaetomium inaequale TaxID=2588326 RepID=A0AAN6PRN6_9PEZI|nr:MBOAT, membrane-bound O-acyltransferase family-domain-containing protein [Parachaetomium inaequale]